MSSGRIDTQASSVAAGRRRSAVAIALATAVALPLAVGHGASATSAPPLPEDFVAQGPAGIDHLASSGNLSPVSGAINAVAIDPNHDDVVWIGSVNGGIWKTTDALAAMPHWTPLTDHLPSLSIGAMKLDPADPSGQTVVAATGVSTSFVGRSGPLDGLIRTTDGGATWTSIGATTLAGVNVTSIAPSGNVILATSKGAPPAGVWRVDLSAGTITRLSADASSGLPLGPAFDLAADPSDAQRVYAAVGGAGGGIFRTDDGGLTWTSLGGWSLGGADASLGSSAGSVDNVEMSVSPFGALDIAVDVSGSVAALASSTDDGATWSAFPASAIPPMYDFAQGATHLSLVADPFVPNRFYVSGTGESNPNFHGGGTENRCDTLTQSCTSITRDGTSDESAPHSDSRDMELMANGSLVETDDGGIFRQTAPGGGDGHWVSMNGDLSITETHSCGFDAVTDNVVCGTQDNGTAAQFSPGLGAWASVGQYDGNTVGISDESGTSTRYWSAHGLDEFQRQTCAGPGSCDPPTSPALTINGGGGQTVHDAVANTGAVQPMAVDQVCGDRLAISSVGHLWESADGADSFDEIGGFSGTGSRAIAYSGRDCGTVAPLYAGSTDGLFLRDGSGGGMQKLTAYPGKAPVHLALRPGDWRDVAVVDGTSVYRSTDAGATWRDITGDLGSHTLWSVAIVPGSGADVVVVGAEDGVYATDLAGAAAWSKLSGSLPNAVAYHLLYDAAADVLLVGTLGRGAWTLAHASSMNLPPVVDAGPDGTVDEGSAFDSAGSFSDPDGGAGQTYSATVDYGDGGGPVALALTGTSFALHHVYAENGTYTVTVTVTDSRGGTGSDAATVTVDDAAMALTPHAVSTVEGTSTGTVVLATLVDPGDDGAGAYSASVDWGDGSATDAGTVSRTSAGHYRITGAHTYADEGTFHATVRVTDTDSTRSPSQRVSTTADVSVGEGDALSGTANVIHPVAGVQFSGAVAAFSDINSVEPASDLVATIDWGDGSSSAGVVGGGAGTYPVTGTHTYAYPASLPVRVTLTDGAPGTATAAVTSDAEIGCPAYHTITGTVTSALTLSSGAWCLNGARVSGNLTLSGGSIRIDASTIGGALTSRGEVAITVCGSTVGGSVTVASTSTLVELGDAGDDLATTCGANTLGGPMSVDATHGPVELGADTVKGALSITNTTAPAGSVEGGVEIEGNVIQGSLSCSGNAPAPSDDGRANTVSGKRSGQCGASGF